MEYCDIPFKKEELESENYQLNYNFLEKLEKEVLKYEVFDHPFLKKLSSGDYTKEGVRFTLMQFGKIVMPFTAAICKLMGNAPDLKSRFMLMDNLYEELGNMQYTQCHPSLYMEMLASIGGTQKGFNEMATISSIRILNNTILDAVEHKSFAIGCAWLGYGGELTIPNNFPYLVKGIESSSFEKVDMTYWDRHGSRDQAHSDDATVVLCMNTAEEEYQAIKEAVIDSLSLRARIWSELEEICDAKYATLCVINGKETQELPKEYQALHRYYAALNSGNIEKMKDVWSKEKTTAFTSPLGGIVRTYTEVVQAHEVLFSIPIKIDVEYYDIEITLLENGFSSVGRERGIMIINGKTIDVAFRTSRLFVKENGVYKQLHHHGSFEEVATQEKIMNLLATIAA
jgi:pyrroloquinoline quinone (PQQ) biosynthesis protein C